MWLDLLVAQLCDKFPSVEQKAKELDGTYLVAIAPNHVITLSLLDPTHQNHEGLMMSAPLPTLPQLDLEAVLMELSEANFLQQGTGDSLISLPKGQENPMLQLTFNTQIHYPAFEELVESFVNYVEYWQRKIINYQNRG